MWHPDSTLAIYRDAEGKLAIVNERTGAEKKVTFEMFRRCVTKARENARGDTDSDTTATRPARRR